METANANQKATCPVGLEAIIDEVVKIMKENIGKLTISLDVSRSEKVSAPWVNVYIHDERKRSRAKIKCDSFKFDSEKDSFFDQKTNDRNWNLMLKYIEKVRP